MSYISQEDEKKLDKWFEERRQEFVKTAEETADAIHSRYKVSVHLEGAISLLLQAAYWQGQADEALSNLLWDEGD